MTRAASSVLLYVFAFLLFSLCVHAKGVHIGVSSSWLDSPLSLEVAEALSNVPGEFFWKFLREYVPLDQENVTPKDEYLHAWEIANSYLFAPHHAPLVQYALATRHYNPVIATHYDFASFDFSIDSGCSVDHPYAIIQWEGVEGRYNEQGEVVQTSEDQKEEETEDSQLTTIHKRFVCDPIELKTIIVNLSKDITIPKTIWPSFRLPNEHMLGTKLQQIHILLYADVLSQSFQPFKFLLERSNSFTLYMRFASGSLVNRGNVSLQGYGVELALKSTEYRTVDDNASPEENDSHTKVLDPQESIAGINFHKLITKRPELSDSLHELREDLWNSENEIRPLKRWEMTDLSMQAAYAASTQEEVWKFLTELTGNFPSLAPALATVDVPDTYRTKIKGEVEQRREYVAINGRPLDLTDFNPYDLFTTLEEEFDLYDTLALMDVPLDLIKPLMEIKFAESDYRLNLNDNLLWINNLETDKQYSRWPKSLYELFKPLYPERFIFVRKNLLSLVLFVDPVSEEAFELYSTIEMYHSGNAPVRLALLFDRDETKNARLLSSPSGDVVMDDEPLPDVLISCYYYLFTLHGSSVALQFMSEVATQKLSHFSLHTIRDALLTIGKESLDDIYSHPFQEEADNYLRSLSTSLTQKGLRSQSPAYFINGIPILSKPFTSEGMTLALKEVSKTEYTLLQQMAYTQVLLENHDIYSSLLKNSFERFNRAIIAQEEEYAPLVALTQPKQTERLSFKMASQNNLGLGEFLENQLDYISGSRHDPNAMIDDITHYLVLDLSTQQGIKTAIELASRFNSSREGSDADTASLRFALIHNSICITEKEVMNQEGNLCGSIYSDIVSVVGRAFTPNKYFRFLAGILPNFITDSGKEHNDVMQDIKSTVRPGTVRMDNFIQMWKNVAWRTQVLEIHRLLLREIFPMCKRGRNYVITNGRVTELPLELPFLDANGFRLLEDMERKKMIPVRDMFAENPFQHVLEEEPEGTFPTMKTFRSDVLMKVMSVLLHKQYSEKRIVYPSLLSKDAAPVITISALLDPLSTSTRRIAPIMKDLLETFHKGEVDIKVEFMPTPDLSELPLRAYYRYAIRSTSLLFDEDGSLLPHSITFTGIPKQPLFSLSIDSPPSWMVQSLASPHDLDNLILESIPGEFAFAEFVLRSLVIQGSAIDDSGTFMPPRGTELEITNLQESLHRDTIVMANMGYFQFQCAPGLWNVAITPGRSSNVYSFSHNMLTHPIIVSSFSVPYQELHVYKNEGMEDANVLDFPSKASSLNRDQTIHIFSLASGHVYERFLKIMILSVLKNTESPVKFWFVENFLQPNGKGVVEEMSVQYGFQVEFMSYQWPSWLLAQSEKQRVIWAYKILFLDVLFPLDVHRVIFVDADLIVRGDVRELHELDLNGAAYAYTPFCDSRIEMEGFRFWKSGFWKDHLAAIGSGASYHISALYVIDLDHIRDNAVGDILRSVYSNLSQDPNSLANLDQDLPNFTQTHIPIHSLDSSWLWCETWCSDESKKDAKAIDLCNNPLTKTPKLENAVRIVPEWTSLDEEARTIQIPASGLQTVHPIHALIAHSVTEEWESLRDTLKFVGKEKPEEDSAPWYSQFYSMYNDII